MKVLITGGAGFVGANLCRLFKGDLPDANVTAFDNLKRRGSEQNLASFRDLGIRFVHGDIRDPADLASCGSTFDLMIDACAEPSVHAGLNGGTEYLIDTNLGGTQNALEFARKSVGATIFLSTSRVYSLAPLRSLPLTEGASRLELPTDFTAQGVSTNGITEDFPVHLPRSLYGATKLCSEYLIQEYVHSFGVKAVINRCGVLAGPGQFGKVDQGVFTLWVARHHFGSGLNYTGFGGEGRQVRDLLHPRDLYRLIRKQLDSMDSASGQTYNVGGGAGAGSVSLRELTDLCVCATGRSVPLTSDPATNPMDVPWYVTDSRRARETFGWEPELAAKDIIEDIARWVKREEHSLRPFFA